MRISRSWITWTVLLLIWGPAVAATIDWKHWELDAFETAKAQNKIILVSVGMEGCAASTAASFHGPAASIPANWKNFGNELRCLVRRLPSPRN